MQNRGIPLTVVENALANGAKSGSITGRVVYYDADNNVSVVTELGAVITVGFGRLK